MRAFQANHLTILHFNVREQLEGYSSYQGIQGPFHSNDHHSHTYAWQAHAVRTVENTCSAVCYPRDNHRLPWGRGVCGHSLDRVGLGSEHSHQLKWKQGTFRFYVFIKMRLSATPSIAKGGKIC